MPPPADIAELLARGGWELDDVQERHRQHPDTFLLPSEAELAALQPGDSARLIFRLVDQADPIRDRTDPYDDHGRPNLVAFHERMWLHIEQRDGDRFVGILQNLPYSSHTSLTVGSRVEFRERDVIDLARPPAGTMEADVGTMTVQDVEAAFARVDPTRPRVLGEAQQAVCDRHGALPQLPLPFAALIAALDDAWPVYGVRFPPDPERNDCGWAVWDREPDMEAVDDFHVVELGTLRASPAWPYLALPPGWVFVLQEDGTEDVYLDPEVL